VINSFDIFTAADSADSAKARQQGLAFIDGSIPGYALLIGSEPTQALPILKSLTQRKIVVFVIEDTLQNTLGEAGVSLDLDSGIVPMNMTTALGCISRVAQIFGNVAEPGDVLSYARERLFGFTLLLGEATPERLGLAETALSFGCPLLSSVQLPQSVENWKISADYRAAIGNVELHDIVQIAIEERGLKIQVPLPELPVAYSSDFSGQTVRDDSCGACLTGVELVVIGEDIKDERITLTGPDLDTAAKGDQPYAMLIEVSGREMQADFEPVLERQIETIFNDADGIMHRGQRSMVTLRIAQKAIDKGLRLRHLGEVLHARLHNDFGNILSRVQISITTEPAQIQAIREKAQAIYKKRDERMESLSDEDVDTFYTCNLCQTISAGHLCIISPEHPGACGAVDWMDARAAVSIQPVGSNKAVKKEGLLDAKIGQWESVNQITRQESGGAISAYSLYSLMQDPGSACGDFECITAMLPLSNGVMVIEHTYVGMTPSGMDWAMLYEMVGAGVPTPGFLGHSKRALGTHKFISAEGGWRRIVWMNHALREELRPVLEALAAEAGVPGFVDMIATEQNAVSEEEILLYLEAAGHPVLMMEPMM
jgi:acetyl-CoA synthase